VGLGAGVVHAFFASTAICGGETVRVGPAVRRRGSEPVLGKSGRGCKRSVLVVAVGTQAVKDRWLGSARMPASGSVAMATK
jgi:hypothetical protein